MSPLHVSDLAWDSLTPLCNLFTEYLAFVVRPDSPLTDAPAMLQRLRNDAAGLKIALATAIGNANHIALAGITRDVGGRVDALDLDVFDSARDAIAHVLGGRAELGIITAASPVPELEAGTMRCLAISAPTRLAGLYAGVPIWREHGIDCVAGPWRGVIGPASLTPAQVAFWAQALRAATQSAAWEAELTRRHWSGTFLSGAALADFMRHEDTVMTAALGALGLLPSPHEAGP